MKLTVREITVFGMLGGLMYASKLLMEVFPNIHLLGLFITTLTVVYRGKALYPIYIFVFVTGIFGGFAPWWVPYLYIWTILWGMIMLLPKRMPKKVAAPVYMIVSGLHGLLFGVIYAPAQALLYGMDLEATLAWIAVGFPYDVTHAISNFAFSSLVLPLSEGLRRAEQV